MTSPQRVPATSPDSTASRYRDTVDEILAEFDSSLGGLAMAMVDQRRLEAGENVIVQVAKESVLKRYLRQFGDWMIVLLLVSAVITGFLGDLGTASVLVVLVAFNTLIGFVQEVRAEKTMEALEKLVDPSSQVFRDGTLTEVESRSLVPGDVIRLTEGSSVPADVRLITTTAFSTNDFALTGESDPTRKYATAIPHEVPLADRHNLAFAGTTVATGEALGLVTATGMHTELGRIATLSQSAPSTRSPLQVETGLIAKYVSYGVAVVSVVVLIIAVQADLPFKEALLFAVGFACALIPQGLPAEVNTALAAAAGTLARQNALVKKLNSVETLGATHVICTDKTGTLTKNEMTVSELVVGDTNYEVSGIGYQPVGAITPGPRSADAEARLIALLTVGVFANNARLVPPDHEATTWRILGDPTEGALLVVARKAGLNTTALLASTTEVGELPFDSTRKLMTSIRKAGDGTTTAYSKGAPESILARATMIDDGITVRAITDTDRSALLAVHSEKASRALRNLLFARRELTGSDAESTDIAVIERNLTVLGLVSMEDPIRNAVPAAMAIVLGAGVKVNIVTGDFSITAEAIAHQAGLEGHGQLTVVTGTELATMTDATVLAHALRGGTVFSRVAPEDKVRIVDLVKASGHVVAVTGDGINDAPALRHANIGVAMGASGTDVAKQSADIVLLDDSFATLVGAIREGRTIYRNITKGVLSCLTSNVAEFVVNSVSLALASLLGVPLALNILQILAIDLLGEIFPIAALGKDPAEGETMKDQPRKAQAHILDQRSLVDIVVCGALIGGFAIANYLVFYGRTGLNPVTEPVPAALLAQAMSVTYATIMICQLVSIIQRRSVHGFFTRYQFTNRFFWLSIGLALSIMTIILYVPLVAAFFGTGPLSLTDWACVAAAALAFLAIREGTALTRRHLSRLTPVTTP